MNCFAVVVAVPARLVFSHALLLCAIVECGFCPAPFGCRLCICFFRTSSLACVCSDLVVSSRLLNFAHSVHAVRITC